MSENSNFAAACEDAGIAFVGPTVANLERFSDKTTARKAAIDAGVPVVPGSDGPIETAEDIVKFVEEIGLPIIIKVCRVMLCYVVLCGLTIIRSTTRRFGRILTQNSFNSHNIFFIFFSYVLLF